MGGPTQGFVIRPLQPIAPSINSLVDVLNAALQPIMFQVSASPRKLFITLPREDLSTPSCQNNFPPFCNVPSRRLLGKQGVYNI